MRQESKLCNKNWALAEACLFHHCEPCQLHCLQTLPLSLALSLPPSLSLFFLTLLLLLYKADLLWSLNTWFFFLVFSFSLPKALYPHPPLVLTLSFALPFPKCQHSVKEAPLTSLRTERGTCCCFRLNFKVIWVSRVKYELQSVYLFPLAFRGCPMAFFLVRSPRLNQFSAVVPP